MTTYANGDRRLGGADCIVGGGGLPPALLHRVRALQPGPEDLGHRRLVRGGRFENSQYLATLDPRFR
ncbi:MAG: hypothetical protein ACRDRR_15520 [Pseudonocardiaceae bacterium]